MSYQPRKDSEFIGRKFLLKLFGTAERRRTLELKTNRFASADAWSGFFAQAEILQRGFHFLRVITGLRAFHDPGNFAVLDDE